jgi:hypothetical protein
MTSLIAKMAGPKPPEADNVSTERSRITMPRAEAGETLTARLLVARKAAAAEADRASIDLLLQGLVDRLPKPDATWSLDDRAKWLRTAASVFDLVYQRGDGEKKQIDVRLAGQDA